MRQEDRNLLGEILQALNSPAKKDGNNQMSRLLNVGNPPKKETAYGKSLKPCKERITVASKNP